MQAQEPIRDRHGSPVARHLPRAAVARWLRPLQRFLEIESASGVLLLGCTLAAMVVANSRWAARYDAFWHTHLRIAVGDWALDESLLHWVNDGLMTIFFFVVGLEIKRELVAGELRDPRKAALPVVAALGGMLAPAAIFLLLIRGQEGATGWGIPMATDIALVVGFLALLGKRVPLGLKILLLTLAIADDIGAVLVIAVFYSTNVSLSALGMAAAGFGVIWLLNRVGVRRVTAYTIVGAGIWLAFLKSGVHPTVAGVLLGLLTPPSAWVGDKALLEVLSDALRHLRGERGDEVEHHHRPLLRHVSFAAREAASPLERLESALHPWVAFGVMPVFALANAGVAVEPAALRQPVAWAVAAGLVVGKPLGIFALSWLTVRLGWAKLPAGINWRVVLGAGFLAGIGFTMSMFIASLALKGELLAAGKIGTLAGSAASAALGCLLLVLWLPKPLDRDKKRV